ncbi:hypothetical protein BV898_00948 [Hypsibius exemplaris]|uniref:Uncharacterized protein n=1 Tax=Hypsibius exemplaris TaxID=2072580 RepID=A0A1W0XCQ7_HYPEX|nr:hypothetical protein BV898_00948 [Hypsibius exemplaris]
MVLGADAEERGKLSHDAAKRLLTAAGITTRSSGNCDDRENPRCTSLDQIRSETIDAVINFKRQSGARVVVTGGTEKGHAAGTYSHWNGYKLDIAKDATADAYITGNFVYLGQLNNGWKQYKDRSDNVWTNEGNHWDVVVK